MPKQKAMRFFYAMTLLLLSASFAVRAHGQATLSVMRDTGLIIGSDGIQRYDGLGTFMDQMISVPDSASGLQYSCCFAFGPDENLYVANLLVGNVLRFNGVTGEFIDTFIPKGSGGLIFPMILVFREGYLYVGDTGAGAIRRYDALTGAYVDDLVPADDRMGRPGALQFFAFGPDGKVYVSNVIYRELLRYDGLKGTFIDNFVPTNGAYPAGLAFGADGLLYVAFDSGEVRRYDIHTRSSEVFIKGWSTLDSPAGIAFGPDGNFYAASSSAISQYDGKTGAYLGSLVPKGSWTFAFKAKTNVCHRAGGDVDKSKTLSVGYWSAREHLRHGDTLGLCK